MGMMMNKPLLFISTCVVAFATNSCSKSSDIGKYASRDGKNIIIFTKDSAYLGGDDAPGKDDIEIIERYGVPIASKGRNCQIVGGLTLSYSNDLTHSCNLMRFDKSDSEEGIVFRAKCENRSEKNCPFPISNEEKYRYEYLISPGVGVRYVKIYDDGSGNDQVYYYKSGPHLLDTF
jgi:hypothetical protein